MLCSYLFICTKGVVVQDFFVEIDMIFCKWVKNISWEISASDQITKTWCKCFVEKKKRKYSKMQLASFTFKNEKKKLRN